MGLEAVSDKIEVKVSGKRLWKALCENAPSVLPKASPEVIEKVVDDGDCLKPGVIRTIHLQKCFAEKRAKEKNIDHLITYAKEKLLEIDQHSHTLRAEVIEGGFIGVLVKQYIITIQLEEIGPDTSILHWNIDYESLSDGHKAHIPNAFKEHITKGIHSIEAFLISHHDY